MVSVHVGAVLEEERHNVRVVIVACKPQGPITCPRISAMLQKKLHDSSVAVLACTMQR
jgi:hypothetical protein